MLVIFVSYLGVHAVGYTLIFRHLAALSREKAIFLYHAVPAVPLSLGILAWSLADPAAVPSALVVLIVAAHGIYSISFLELWSLSEGSYSLSILERIDRSQTRGVPLDHRELERIGELKGLNRIGSLWRLGLVREREEGFELTWIGRCVAAFLSVISWLANSKRAG